MLPQQMLLQAQPRELTDYQVKAAYLYNFGKFVKWPGESAGKDAFSICIAGNPEFADTLRMVVQGQRIGDSPVQVQEIENSSRVQGCRILYVGEYGPMRPETAMAAAKRYSVLTVSDMPRFTQRGGMIQFVMDGGRVRFEVNLPAAEEAGLGLSSDLLKVAKSVMQSRQRG